MPEFELDDIDRGILGMLQGNARDATIEAMGERVGVSASTVRNRINDMEDAGVIEGYHPQVNYAKGGFDLHVLYLCHAPTTDRSRITRDILDVDGTLEVFELLDSSRNVVVEAAAQDADHLAETHDSIVELGVTIRDTLHVRTAYTQPFDHFGTVAEEQDDEP